MYVERDWDEPSTVGIYGFRHVCALAQKESVMKSIFVEMEGYWICFTLEIIMQHDV